MQWRPLFLALLAAAALWQGYASWRLRPVHPSDGAIAPDEPRQTDVEAAPVTTLGRWRLTPRAHYEVTARILGREDYHFDQLADLIPEDLALGWGPMSDNRVLRTLEITQAARFYSWMPRQTLPIPRQAVIEHSANTHVIPADALVAAELRRLRVGQVVHLSGYLVSGVRDDGAYINTSLTRSDSGPGSCEVMLVEEVEAR
ncbi:MAG TPA: hypothetical protein VE819_00570 [Steroidobacteraceae bacterium]|jgi:hypothetical protein|nr:hypothetical protein [Steroidobacteraceae bacterium]